jgi:hypothetical protein
MFDTAQVRQAGNEHDARVANGKKHARVVRVDNAPSWTTGELEC